MADHNNDHTQDAAIGASRTTRLPMLSLVVAVLIAAVLQFAGAAKVASGADDLRRIKDSAARVEAGLPATVDRADFDYLVPPGEILEGGILLDFAVAAAEFALVVIVLAFHRTRAVWLLVSLVFATFTGYSVQRLLNGLPCGCFGDLWHPPDGLTVGLDIFFVIAGLTIAGIRGTPPRVLLATIGLAIGGIAGGYVYSAQTSPPSAERQAEHAAPARQQPAPREPAPERSQTDPSTQEQEPDLSQSTPDLSTPPSEKLLRSDLMADVREAHAAGEPTAYYVFIWDPTCTTCERLLPIVEHYERVYAEEGNIFLQIRTFKKQDLARGLGIQDWEWPDSPSAFLVQDGRIVRLPGGEETPMPDTLLAKIEAGAPIDAD